MSVAAWNPTACALALETSGAVGCVAVGRGERALRSRRFSAPRAHAVEFLPAIDDLCRSEGIAPRDIEWVFVSAGPGSFTGLRIGITAARALALALGARIVAIPTLEVIAQNASDATAVPDRLAVILDAKRKRVYAATFERRGDRFAATSEPRESDPLEFLNATDPRCAVMGEGVLYHREAIAVSGRTVLPKSIYPPKAEVVYRLGVERAARGITVPFRELVPIYIRPPEAEELRLARQSAAHPEHRL